MAKKKSKSKSATVPRPPPSQSDSSSVNGVLIYTPSETEVEQSLVVNDVVDALQKLKIDSDQAVEPTQTEKTSKPKQTRSKAKTQVLHQTPETLKAATHEPSKKKSKTKKKTVVGAWKDYFGDEGQLANWQKLCTDVGMDEIPTSITQCRKALNKVWVNIYDFLDAKAEGKPVRKFKSEWALAKYTLDTGKVYPKKHAKEGGPARTLLAHIFRH